MSLDDEVIVPPEIERFLRKRAKNIIKKDAYTLRLQISEAQAEYLAEPEYEALRKLYVENRIGYLISQMAKEQ